MNDYHAVPKIPINPSQFRKTGKDSKNSDYIYVSIIWIMLEDYKKAVISSYHKKKEQRLLSSNLAQPTPAKLREECLRILNSRLKEKDEKILREFFNYGIESSDYGPCIRKFDRDKMKPLDNFIAGETEVRDEKNVEILAWLIDFEPRPYDDRIDYTKNVGFDEENQSNRKKATSHSDPWTKPEEVADSDQKPKSWLEKKFQVSIITITLLISGIYFSANYWTSAYICDHGTGTKYHLSSKCVALKNCKNGISKTTIAEAVKNGKTLCGLEN